MPAPSKTLSTLRPELAAFEQFDLAMDRQGFIGAKVLPFIEVGVASGAFGKIPLKELLQNRETARSPRSGYNRGDWSFEDDSFATKEHGWEEPVDDNEARVYREYFDMEQICAARAYDIVLRSQERRAAALLYNTDVWTGATLTTDVTNEWDDATNATPVVNVNAAKLKVWELCGLWPDAIIMNRFQFHNLRMCDEIKEAIASTGAGDSVLQGRITAAQIAQALDLDHVFVAGSAQNTAKRGAAADISQIWSNEYAMVCRVASGPDMREPCIGRTFHWDADGSLPGGVVETYEDVKIRGQVVRVRHQTHEKILYPECGHLLGNITT